MAEIFGAVAASIAVGSELIRLGCAIQKRIKRIKNSRKDIQKLANETIMFAGLYQRFLRACDEDPNAYRTDAAATRPLITWAQSTVDSLKELLQKVEALHPQSKPRFNFEDKAISHLVWYRSASAVKTLRVSLSVARESINGFSNLMCLDKLKELLKAINLAMNDPVKRSELEQKLGGTLEDKILVVNQDIADSQAIHHENKKFLAQAKHKIAKYQGSSQTNGNVPTLRELDEFTEALDDYARDILPSRTSGIRTSNLSSSSSASRSISTNSLPSRPPQSTIRTPLASNSINRREAVASGDSNSTALSGSSRRPTQVPTTRSTSPSDTFSVSESIPDVVIPSSNPRRQMIEHSSTRAKEYVNDPRGDIFSPPILRESLHPSKMVMLGRHVIEITAASFYLNGHPVAIGSRYDYAIADMFFSALIENSNELDKLDQVLRYRHRHGPQWTWGGIPGWIITANSVRMLPATLGI